MGIANWPANIRDSMLSFLSGLGGPKDKSQDATYILKVLSPLELQAAYRCDWIARKIVNIPAEDATREWRMWQADNDQIELIEDTEERLSLQEKTLDALIRARLNGGSAIIMGIDGQRLEDELDLNTVKKDSLKFVHVVNHDQISAKEIERDMESPWYGHPKFWERNLDPNNSLKTQRIHPSRVIPFIGNKIPNETDKPSGIWGDSVLMVVDDAVRAAGLCAGGIAALISEMKYDIIHIPEFNEMVSTKETADRLTARFAYANTAKSIVNALLVDKEEEWETRQVAFNGMPEIMQQYMVIASGAADIPVTRMLGQAPKGLNATGESDIRNYYDNCSSKQKNQLSPTIKRLDEVVIRSSLGERDPDVWYKWTPLWQQSETEKAGVDLQRAQAFKIDYESGMIPDAALAQARTNQLIEAGTYPGLEDAVAELDWETIYGDPNEPQKPDPITGATLPISQHPKDPELARIAAKPAPKLLAGPNQRTVDHAASDLISRWRYRQDRLLRGDSIE